jgi:hypothetical protein
MLVPFISFFIDHGLLSYCYLLPTNETCESSNQDLLLLVNQAPNLVPHRYYCGIVATTACRHGNGKWIRLHEDINLRFPSLLSDFFSQHAFFELEKSHSLLFHSFDSN